MKRTIPILMLLLILAGCAIFKPYQPDIQQGNIITAKMIQKLKTGMSPAEVDKAMEGAPVLVNIFSQRRMLYVYTYHVGKGKTTKSQVVLTFNNGKLVKIERVKKSVLCH
ncbi:MAG: outer membrane protein assembly factor BamE [Gammaproteobacteria bacterium]|nr:outer membrane protein assembly factor BamE [Gammaproteobacteria bacterium]